MLREIILDRLGYEGQLLSAATKAFYYYLEINRDSTLQLIQKNNQIEKGLIFPLDDLNKINMRIKIFKIEHSKKIQKIKNKSRFKSGTKGVHFLIDRDHLSKLDKVLKSKDIPMREFFNQAIISAYLEITKI